MADENGEHKVDPKSSSYLLFQNLVTQADNIRLREQLLAQEKIKLADDVRTSINQLAEETGIKKEDIENYQFDPKGLRFVKFAKPKSKKGTRKKAKAEAK